MCNIWLDLGGNLPTMEVDDHGDFLPSSGWGHLHLSRDPELELYPQAASSLIKCFKEPEPKATCVTLL